MVGLMFSSPDILILFPGHLEALTNRGGGREARLLRVALELSEDFNVTIVAPFFGEYRKTIKIQPRLTVDNLYFPASNAYPPKSQFTKLMQLLSLMFYSIEAVAKTIQFKRKGLRVVLVSDFTSGALPTFVAKVLRLKVLCYEGNITPWANPYVVPRKTGVVQAFLNAFTGVLAGVTSRLSEALVVNDGLIKTGLVRRGVAEDKIFVIRGVVDTESFKPLRIKSPESKEFLVGFNGRLTDEKGASFLLDLCTAALSALPQVRFVVLGDGPYKEKFAVLPNVRHVGQVAYSEICSRFSSVKAVITFQKTFGMGEVEALSCGKPLIASRVGEMSKLIVDGETGLLCDPNVDSYIQAIEMLLRDEALLVKLSENSRKEAIRSYSLDVGREKWQFAVRHVLENSAPYG